MAHVIADRVFQVSSTTGTGTLTLGAAVTGFRGLADVCGNADSLFYSVWAVDANGNPSGEWEVGLGTYDTGTLARTTVLSSSNAGAAVDFAAGTKYVQLAVPAASLLYTTAEQSGATYTAAIADMNDYVRFINAAGVTFTIPPNSSVPFPIGTRIHFEQGGAGTVTVAPGSDVTINSRGAALDTAGQFAVASVIKTAEDAWTLFGDIA